MPLRLKHLELHGYKTFATRSNFIFGEGITAVVGPNGSGKSNIADSIRWVLGEQSFQLLRGKKTEDMIFAGSELRPRAGMASAALTFDNADGWLPIDFSEVTINRRAYRDGENEYLLNGQRVRLRDIAELLSQCGLSERTYTIIGQGLVDTALSLKPEERRALFEEAAGIGIYRAKREDALRKLEQTHHNLERVQDLLAEIRPRLRSLERQAQRTREYAQVKHDLDELLKVWYGYHWERAQRELAEAHEQAEVQAAELADLQNQQESLDARLQELRARVSALRAQLNTGRREAVRLQSEREGLSRELAVADERLRSLALQREDAQAELAPLENDLAAAAARVAAARADLTRLQSELDEARAQLAAAQTASAEREAERRRWAAQESEARAQQAQVSGKLAERAAHETQIAARRAQVEAALAQQRRVAAAAEAALAAAQGSRAARDSELREAAASRERAESEWAAAQKSLAEVEEQIAALNSRYNDRLAEEQRLTVRQETLQQARAQMAAYASGAKALLAAAREGRIGGTRGALAELLGVPADLEAAIGAALAVLPDPVVVEDWPDAQSALDLLAAEGGRAAVLPLARLSPPPALVYESGPDILGRAAELVTCDPSLRPAVEALFGRTLIVRTREAAQRIAPTLPPEARAVTLVGEVYLPSGAVVGGREAGPSALGQAREERDLLRQVEHARNNRLWAVSAREHLEAEAGALRETLVAAQARMNAAQSAERAALAGRDEAALSLSRAEQEMGWQREQAARFEGELEALAREAEAVREAMAQLSRERAALEQQVADLSAQLAAFAAAASAEQLGHWQTVVAVSSRALDDARARLEELERARAGAEALAAVRRARTQTYQAEADSLSRSVAAQRQREAEISAQLAALAAEIEPADRRLAELEAEQARVESEEGRARTALHVAERRHADAQLALARKKEELEALRRRIEEDFGLVELDYNEAVTGPTPLPLHPLVEKLPHVEGLPEGLEDSINRRRLQLRRMGAINPEATTEYAEVKERHDFLTAQVADLETAQTQLREVIAEMDLLMERDFRKTFDAVAAEFRETFTRLFGGGSAKLLLTDPDHVTTTGIDILARLPGRRQQGLAMLSGGERSLTASALIFALLRVSPPPICLMDEVDAMLDEANVGRFRDMLVELSSRTQFVVITHNRHTVQAADTVYGISMGADSASQVISLKLEGEKVAGERAGSVGTRSFQ